MSDDHTVLATSNVSDPMTRIGTWARSGLYYHCGQHTLLVCIPIGSVGVVRLGAPLMLVSNKGKAMTQHDRHTDSKTKETCSGKKGDTEDTLTIPELTHPHI